MIHWARRRLAGWSATGSVAVRARRRVAGGPAAEAGGAPIWRLAILLAFAALFVLGTYTELGCGGLTTSPEPSGPTGDLAGTITDAATGTPIATASVRVDFDTSGVSLPVDAQGRYSLFGLPLGTARFTANASGYRPVTETITIREGQNRKDVALTRN